jgi:hypothetical protein
MKKITWDDVLEEFEIQFPKGKSKERGKAIVVLAYGKMVLDAIVDRCADTLVVKFHHAHPNYKLCCALAEELRSLK